MNSSLGLGEWWSIRAPSKAGISTDVSLLRRATKRDGREDYWPRLVSVLKEVVEASRRSDVCWRHTGKMNPVRASDAAEPD